MNRIARAAVVLAAMAAPGQAFADGCPSSYVCAAKPDSVVASLQAQGYRAMLGKSDSTGNPKIESAANGYNYSVLFYGCEKGENCTSLGFMITFEKDPTNTAQLANEWNKANRFSQMALNDDGTLSLSYDISTVGGLSQPNFADVVDWWQVILGNVRVFFNKHPAPGK
ncbi:MAG: YbjN domain-containing protein [Sphingomonadales bacterium]|nr:YbjN domain-containing protein [Sphingomonadales bacterium]